MYRLKLKRKVLITVITITLSFTTAGILLVKPFIRYLSVYLTKTNPETANILVVEGWIRPDYTQFISEEYRKNNYDLIVITGQKSQGYFQMSENGFLIFNLKGIMVPSQNPGSHKIQVECYSSLKNEHAAKFRLFINDFLLSEFTADKNKNKYQTEWVGDINSIDSIMIEFCNDAVGDFGDVNLWVKSVSIDDSLYIPYYYSTTYDIDELDNQRRFNISFGSNAEELRSRLLNSGLDSGKVVAVAINKHIINRTLNSALSFRGWIDSVNMPVNGINIISLGTHARRTWLTYNKVLNEKFRIGIIALPDTEASHNTKLRILKTVRETIALLYYWIILLPY